MKDKRAIEAEINRIATDNEHVLTGSLATVQINAPRALMQISAESRLATLYWVLGRKYVSKLKGVNQ